MSKKYPPQQLQQHVPVLLNATLELLQPKKGEMYLDLTAGYGGHAQAILAQTEANATLVDRDEHAIHHLQQLSLHNVELLHEDFATAAAGLVERGKTFDLILVDLGVSSPQLDNRERGFSFRLDAPIDMRMDKRQSKTAADIVNMASEHELTEIITTYGEERPRDARAIAQAIVEHRPFSTTGELADVVRQTIHSRGKIHPATRTFQALRIATNDELQQIESLLPLLPRLLRPGGRVAIISFHSLEDRLVKQYFRSQKEMGLEAELEPLSKRPIQGSTDDVHNPRSRSAKLRGAVKINNKNERTTRDAN